MGQASNSRLRSQVLPARHPDIEAALQILPAATHCPRELYRELLDRDSPERRVVVISDRHEPQAVIGLRRRKWSWEPITNWIVPGYLFPVQSGQLGQALRTIREPLFVSWWRQPQPPPTELAIRGLKRVATHGTRLDVDLDAMWGELKLSRSLRKARERTQGFELEVNAPGASEWVIRSWLRRWQGSSVGETPELLDRLAVAHHLERLGLHFTLTLRDGDRWVAGNTNVVHGRDFVCQTSWRDLSYAKHGLGVRLEELTFRWAQQAGFAFYDLGGGHDYKRHWAPATGERWQFEYTSAVGFLFGRAASWFGRAANWLGARAASPVRPSSAAPGLLGLGPSPDGFAAGFCELAATVASYLYC
jgi:hypothetical protein